MAGHSKWSNTKHRKTSQDVKKSKIFTKIIKELIIASKTGGENPDINPNLRAIIEKALQYNMSRNTIERTINKNISNNKNSYCKKMQYGAFGKKGVAILLDCFSNNSNRTVSEIRYIFSKFNFNLVPIPSVEYLFKKQGIIFYLKTLNNIKIKNVSIQYDAKYIFDDTKKYIKVIANTKVLHAIQLTLNSINIKPSYTQLFLNAYTLITLNKEEYMIFNHFIKTLKKNTDIQNIYHNVLLVDSK